MPVKETIYITMNNNTFQNPSKKCLEELKLKLPSNENTYKEAIPAMDARWCKKHYLPTLYTPPPTKNCDGEFTMGSKEDWVERMNFFIEDTTRLLQLEYHKFWSEVKYNKHILDGVYSFLQSAPPSYSRETIPEDKEIIQQLKTSHKLVLLSLIRLTSPNESETKWMKSSTLGSILYDDFILSLPQLMDICSIFGNDNIKEVRDLINRVIKVQPRYISDIEKSTNFICEVFMNLENQLGTYNNFNDGLSSIPQSGRNVSHVQIMKILSLLLDITFSVGMFLEMCPQAGIVFHEQNLEPRLANFYENIITELTRLVESEFNTAEFQNDFLKYQSQINFSRHQIIMAVNGCLTSYLSSILEERKSLKEYELKDKVDNYLNSISDCISNLKFIFDYNSVFSIESQIQVLHEICPDLDSTKCDFIVEAVFSSYDLHSVNQQTLETQPDEGACASTSNTDYTPQLKGVTNTKVTGVELQSLITEVKDILPQTDEQLIVKSLEFYNYSSAEVIDALLTGTLPDHIMFASFPSEDSNDTNGLPERINIYDNDEFDVMARSIVDSSRVHRGKRQDHKSMFEMLDDKTHVNQLRDVYTQLSLVEYVENANEYDDEYDDTYDDVDAAIGNEGETEAEARRPFVIPRVLEQRNKPLEEQDNQNYDEYEEESEEVKPVLFLENPADIRARAEQRRLDQRGRGNWRSKPAFPHNNVVGKPKGQGQDKDVVINREVKNTNKAFRANHNRRFMADKKRRQGMFP